MKKIFIALVIVSLSLIETINAQTADRLKDGLKFYTNYKDSSCFIKLNMNSQIWSRFTENNPQTLIQGRKEQNTSDLSIRRIRFVLSGQLSDRISFFMQFGQNNLNYLSARKAGAFFHDVTTDYAVIKKHLSIGFGLNGWNGPSRFSNISTTSILGLDPPNYQEVTNDTYDQFVRRLGIYAKGKIGRLDYRISAGKPFVIQTASGVDPINANSSFSTLPPNMVYQGYFMYQFLNKESNFGPSNAGTYLGSKKVFNLGGGFYYQKDAMFHQVTTQDNTLPSPTSVIDTAYQNILLYAFDIFYDAPINKEKGTAFSFYGCYSNYNYGDKFIKVTGPDNPGSSSGNKNATNFNKASYGNAFPYLGTGTIFYAQTAYKFRNHLLGDQGTLQIYANCQYANYTRLKDPMIVYDAGINWLINGTRAKFTLNYQNRPFFLENTNGDVSLNSRKGCVVLQYQVSF